MKILNSVIETADVVLEILDARDPLNCRSIDIENLIVKTKCKKLILILNKIDLIPLDNAIQWQNYLKQEHTTLLFKANTQNQGNNLSQSTLFNKNIQQHKEYVDTILQGNKAVGSEEIINVLKNYARNQNIKTKLTVGVIGYPNVGKSSIINSLKRGKVVGVSSTPGFTKGIQEVVLDGDIKLIDCPGVVFSKNEENNLLQNVIRIEDIKEPINAVISILKKVSVDYLVQTYELDVAVLKGVDVSSEKLLYLIGDKMKKYKKGGSVDLDKAARLLIADWNSGKLKYHTTPPNYADGGMNLD
jgi:nuclear GTP-binding protein